MLRLRGLNNSRSPQRHDAARPARIPSHGAAGPLGTALLVVAALGTANLAHGSAPPAGTASTRLHVSIDPVGLAITDRAALAEWQRAIGAARASGLPPPAHFSPRRALSAALSDLARLGVDTGASAVVNFDSLEIVLPADARPGLARLPWVRRVRTPQPPIPSGSVDSEWLARIGSDGANMLGVTGSGITVAIIDTGFAVLDETVAAGELIAIPANSKFEERPQNSGTIQTSNSGLSGSGTHEHGTASAEVVHELAPDANLELYWVQSDAGLQAAIRHAAGTGAKVILVPLFTMSTMSDPVGVGAGGTNEFTDDIDYATALGATVVVAAGNEALRHYEAAYSACTDCHSGQTDLLGICTGPSSEDSSFHTFDLPFMDPFSHLEGSFDLEDGYFYGDSFQLTCMSAIEEGDCADSFRFQLYKIATDSLKIPVCPSDPGSTTQIGTLREFGQSFTASIFPFDFEYALAVKQISGNNSCTPRFRLVCTPGVELVDYSTADGSLSDLAVVESALAVGAADEVFVEDFSSRGPTAGVNPSLKPDLVGPAVATNFAAEEWGFNDSMLFEGTSSGAAHAAGVVALLQARRLMDGAALLPPDGVKLALTGAAFDLEATGPDHVAGHGFLQVPVSVTAGLGLQTPTPLPTPTPTPTMTPSLTPTPGPTPTAHPTSTPSSVWLDPVSSVRCGMRTILTGGGFTAGSVVKVYIATSTGAGDLAPYIPLARTPTSVTWRLPCTVGLGNGFIALQVINKDQNYVTSNTVVALLLATDNSGYPSITGVNGVLVTPAHPSLPLAYVQTLISRGSTITIGGTGFAVPAKVNLFTAAGNAGPLDSLPGSTSTALLVEIPANVPTGPSSLQVVNPRGSWPVSNAVSVPLGATISVSSITRSGNTITVNGTGFSTLSVINFFTLGGANHCGLTGGGTALCPVSLVSDTRFTVQRPRATVAYSGPAFIEVLNPPFIPFSSTGTDPDGAFTLDAP